MNLCVEVSDSTDERERHLQHCAHVQDVLLQKVVQRAVLVVVCYEEELRPRSCSLDVGRNETYQR